MFGFVCKFSFNNATFGTPDLKLHEDLEQVIESLPLSSAELLLPDSPAKDGKRAMLLHSDQNRRAPITSSICDLAGKHAVMRSPTHFCESFEPVPKMIQQFFYFMA